MSTKATNPFINVSHEAIKSRIPNIKSAVKATAKKGISPTNALEIAAACYGFNDYNTLKGMVKGSFYELIINLGTPEQELLMRKEIGIFEDDESAFKAFSELMKRCPCNYNCELYKDGKPHNEINDKIVPIEAFICKTDPNVIKIDGITIANNIFLEDLVDWKLVRKDDEFVLVSSSTEEILSPTRDTEEFNFTCEDILEENADYIEQNKINVKIIDFSNDIFSVGGVVIASEVFGLGFTNCHISTKEFQLEILKSQYELSGYKEILEQINSLEKLTDEIIIQKVSDDKFYTYTDTPNEWNEACRNIIEANFKFEKDPYDSDFCDASNFEL